MCSREMTSFKDRELLRIYGKAFFVSLMYTVLMGIWSSWVAAAKEYRVLIKRKRWQ